MMKGKRMRLLIKKNKKLIIAASLLASLVVGETFAWVAPTLTVNNVLKAHTTNVTVDESFTQDTPAVGSVDKQVCFENTGTSDVFIRMRYEEYWEKEIDGQKYQLSNTVKAETGTKRVAQMVSDVFTSDGNLKEPNPNANPTPLWLDGGDGWYYYTKVLPAQSGELSKTGPVLSKVTFNYDGAEEYETANYHLYFKVEAVQASTSARTLNNGRLEAKDNDVNQKATLEVFSQKATIVDFENKSSGSVVWEFNNP